MGKQQGDTSRSSERQARTPLQLMQIFLQDVTAVPLAADVVLEDFAQTAVFVGRTTVFAALHAFFVDGLADAEIIPTALLGDAETAVLACTVHARQSAPFWGLPCTGRHLTLPMVIICHSDVAQVQRIELYYDAGALLRQLGLAL